MLKGFVLLTFCFLFRSEAFASGCGWSDSHLQKVILFKFKTSGTLNCKMSQACYLTLNHYSDQKSALVLQGGESQQGDFEQKLDSVTAQMVEITEHGSCYNDGVILGIEVEHEGVLFENHFSVQYP